MENQREIWLDIKTMGKLLNLTTRAIRFQILTGQYTTRWVPSKGGKNGMKLEVALSSLPEPVRERYWKDKYPQKLKPRDMSWMMRGSKKKHDTAGSRKSLIEKLNNKLNNRDGRSKAEVIEEFVRQYNRAEIDDRILAEMGQRSVRTFNRWRREDREFGMEGLVPGWTSKTFDELPVDEKMLLNSLWLNENRPSFAFVWRKYKEAGYDTLTYARMKSYLKRIPAAVACLHREGKKAFKDKFGQYIERDYSKTRANEIWSGDHCQLDFAIRGLDGKPLFPWITAWMDIRSRKIMGFCIQPTPCTDTIVASFRDAVLKHGLPELVQIDNGKDFSSRRFSGGRKRSKLQIDEQQMTNLLHGLNVKARFCIPYNPRSKPIERFFRTMKDDFEKEWDTYRGRYRGKERPEGLEAVLKDPNRLPGLPEVNAALQAWIEKYHARPHGGQGMDGKTPEQIWQETLGEKREADPELLRLAMLVVEDRKIQRNGISMFKQMYYHDMMWRYKGQRVRVRYDLNDLGHIDVYDKEENRFLFTAECKQMAQWRMCQDNIKAAQKEAREEQKKVEAYAEVLQRGRRGMPAAARAIQMKKDSLISDDGTLGMEEQDNDKVHALVKQRKELCGNAAESGGDAGSGRRPIFTSYRERDEWEERHGARTDSDGEETGEIH